MRVRYDPILKEGYHEDSEDMIIVQDINDWQCPPDTDGTELYISLVQLILKLFFIKDYNSSVKSLKSLLLDSRS